VSRIVLGKHIISMGVHVSSPKSPLISKIGERLSSAAARDADRLLEGCERALFFRINQC
jgi:hypothetical protein